MEDFYNQYCMAGVTATADTLKEALEIAYKEAEKVHFENKYGRSDIGQRALKAVL